MLVGLLLLMKDLRYSLVYHRKMEVLTIEQLQFTGDESTSTTNNKIKLNFNHPTKELIWVVQPYDNVDPVKTGAYFGPQWFNYTDNFDVTYTSSSAFSVSDVYGGVASPDNAQYAVNNLAGGVPGVAPGGANRVFLPVSFEGGDNPTSIAKIQLNGHDRFAEMDGRYFNLVQPFQHHENIPSRGINVYSFGLKPEEHQPSGTCNFSRIDAANLNLTLTANTVNLNSTSRTAAVRVFAVNYNVLRIMSGMGGLALMLRAIKLLLLVVSGYKKITATFSKCGNLLRYSSSTIVLNCMNLDNPQPMVSMTKVQRLNGNGYRQQRCLRYSPSLQDNSKVERLQLDCYCMYYGVYMSVYLHTQYCFCNETLVNVHFGDLSKHLAFNISLKMLLIAYDNASSPFSCGL